jgi:hypothetical protein
MNKFTIFNLHIILWKKKLHNSVIDFLLNAFMKFFTIPYNWVTSYSFSYILFYFSLLLKERAVFWIMLKSIDRKPFKTGSDNGVYKKFKWFISGWKQIFSASEKFVNYSSYRDIRTDLVQKEALRLIKHSKFHKVLFQIIIDLLTN